MGDDIGDMIGMGDPAAGSLLFPGDKKKKKKTQADRLILRGRAILKAGNELFPETLDLVKRGAEGYGEIYRGEADKTRAGELAQLEKYGPAYAKAISEVDPLQTQLREATNADVMAGLQDSSKLTPALRREIEQAARGAWSARGLNYSPAAAEAETFASGERGVALRQLNLGNAFNLMEANRRVIGDPSMAVLGRPVQPQGSNIMSPDYSSYSNELPSFQANQEIQHYNERQAAAARKAQLQAAGISAAGSIVGGAAGAFI